MNNFKKGQWVYYLGYKSGGIDTEYWKEGVIAKVSCYGISDSLTVTEASFGHGGTGANFSTAFRLATKQEIEDYLVQEAKKRGFAQGVECTCVKDWHRDKQVSLGTKYTYENSDDSLWVYDSTLEVNYHICIYYKGKWAEIIKSNTNKMEKKITGYTFKTNEFKNAFCKIMDNYSVEELDADYKNRDNTWHFSSSSLFCNKAQQLGLIDTWCTPYYAEEELTIGTHKVKINTNQTVQIGCRTVSKQTLVEVLDCIKASGYNSINIANIQITEEMLTKIIERL